MLRRSLSLLAVRNISFKDVISLSHSTPIIDVRTTDERDTLGHIPGSVNIPLDQVKAVLRAASSSRKEDQDKAAAAFANGKDSSTAQQELPLDVTAPIVFACQLGGRSLKAATMAQDELGYTNVANFPGGYKYYKEEVEKQK